MKQQALAIAAATMLTVGLGIANASEQSGTLEQSSGTDMAACSSDHTLCLNNEEMVNDAKQVSQQDTEVIILEELTEDADAQDQTKEEDSGMAEQASDESQAPDVIIFVQ